MFDAGYSRAGYRTRRNADDQQAAKSSEQVYRLDGTRGFGPLVGWQVGAESLVWFLTRQSFGDVVADIG